MKRLVYVYEDGREVEHTVYVTKRTIKREMGNSKIVSIYENGKFVSTLLLN